MDHAMIVQVRHAGRDAAEPAERFGLGIPLGCLLRTCSRLSPRDVFHDDPIVALLVLANVKQREQVGVLEVQALVTPRSSIVEIAPHEFERDLFARIAYGVVNFAEPAVADAALQRVAIKRPLAARVQKTAPA